MSKNYVIKSTSMGSSTWHPPTMRTVDIEAMISDLSAAGETEGLLYEGMVAELARRQASRTVCRCGSGRERHSLVDAAGIFCAYVCDSCEDKVRSRYNPAIFGGNLAYTSSGNEDALEIDYSNDFDGY